MWTNTSFFIKYDIKAILKKCGTKMWIDIIIIIIIHKPVVNNK